MIFCYRVITNVRNLDTRIPVDDPSCDDDQLGDVKGAFFTFNVAMRQPVSDNSPLKQASMLDWRRRNPSYANGLTSSDFVIDQYTQISLLDFVWQRLRGLYRGGATFYVDE